MSFIYVCLYVGVVVCMCVFYSEIIIAVFFVCVVVLHMVLLYMGFSLCMCVVCDVWSCEACFNMLSLWCMLIILINVLSVLLLFIWMGRHAIVLQVFLLLAVLLHVGRSSRGGSS